MKFALAGLVLIREFVRAEWLKTRGDISFDYVVSTACSCSREIEHSDTNKIKMERCLKAMKDLVLRRFSQYCRNNSDNLISQGPDPFGPCFQKILTINTNEPSGDHC